MTRHETEALTTAHFAACNDWALGVIEAAFKPKRTTITTIHDVMPAPDTEDNDDYETHMR